MVRRWDEDGRGYSETATSAVRDRPLTFHWQSGSDNPLWLLGVPRPSSSHAGIACDRIIAAVVLAAEEDRWVSYSRRREFYIGQQRYGGRAFTYTHILTAVQNLVHLGLVVEERSTPGQLGWQSRLRATCDLMELVAQVRFVYDPVCDIRLKDVDGRLIDYRDTDTTWRMSRELQNINAILSEIDVDLPGSDIVRTGHHLLVDGAYYRPTEPALYRVFNRGSFRCGGRAFGWWQNLPKARRKHLRINGEVVAEPDFAQLHPSLLYAARGCQLVGDAYEVGEYPRDLTKLAFNVGVNTATFYGWIAALTTKPNWPLSWSETATLARAIVQRHPLIADDLHADRGIALMNLDSQIIIRAVGQCLREGIPVLPVHDSMLTPQRQEGRVAEIMEASAETLLKCSKPCRVGVSSLLVPQMPPGGGG